MHPSDDRKCPKRPKFFKLGLNGFRTLSVATGSQNMNFWQDSGSFLGFGSFLGSTDFLRPVIL